tara:strand:- start:176 stop:487 length:312 start_codon:yes stop_codon:yes gene_type:complete
VSPILKELIKEIAETSSDELSYELWREVCIKYDWIEVNIQQDDWVDSIKDDTKRELIMAYNSLNQNLKWNTKKKEKRLFRKGDEVISFEKDLEGYWEYLSQNK